jgi:hypothetical protein
VTTFADMVVSEEGGARYHNTEDRISNFQRYKILKCRKNLGVVWHVLWYYSFHFVRCSECCSPPVSTEWNVPREIRRRESESVCLSLKNKPHSRAGMHTNPRRLVAVAIKFCSVASNICGTLSPFWALEF